MIVPVKLNSFKSSSLETELLDQIIICNIEVPTREFYFHPTRRWRSDFAWVNQKLLVEVEGGIYKRGRHVRGKGFEADCEKYNTATTLGYKVIRVTKKHIKSGQAIEWIEKILKKRN